MKLITPTSFICAASIAILCGAASLHASNQISKYEQAGDYAKALTIARGCYGELLDLGLSQEAASLSQTIARLENSLLTVGSSRLLFDENDQPRVKLLQLLDLVGMGPSSKKDILQISNWAQKNLLRQGERWQEQTDKFEGLKTKIKPLLRDLGFIDGSLPHFDEYQGAIVHGALVSGVRFRLHYLVEQWKRGVRFSHLYFLSGERPLDAQKENRAALSQDEGSPLKIRKDWFEPAEFPKTECEMIQLVWDQSEIPTSMRNEVEVHFINAPMKKDMFSDRLLRPTTNDTVDYWLKAVPPPGRYLAVSNAPYINRQDLVVRGIAPREFSFDTVGPAAGEQEKVAIFLDELARLIFQTHQTEILFGF